MLFILDHLVTPRGQTGPLPLCPAVVHGPSKCPWCPPGGTLRPDQVTEPQV